MIKEYALVPTGPTKMIDMQRAEAGAKKYLEDISRGVLISGFWNGEKSGGYFDRFYGSQTQDMFGRLWELKVPKEVIKYENKSKNTIENVFYSCKFFVDERAESTIICSDKEHAKRIEMLFGVAKDDKILPRDFNIEIFSEGLDPSYPYLKAQMAYWKDYFKTFNGIKVD